MFYLNCNIMFRFLTHVFIYISICNVKVYSFSTTQWSHIRNILTHDETPNEMRNMVKRIMFQQHIPYTFYQTIHLQQSTKSIHHYSKSQIRELNDYAIYGLLQAIDNYNGYGNFYSYVTPYIRGSLYSGISQMNGIRMIPHHLRVNRNWKKENRELYVNYMRPPTYVDNQMWILDAVKKQYCSEMEVSIVNRHFQGELTRKIMDCLDEFSPSDRYMFLLRYDVTELSCIRSVTHTADLMCMTPEYVRRRLGLIKDTLKIRFGQDENNDVFIDFN